METLLKKEKLRNDIKLKLDKSLRFINFELASEVIQNKLLALLSFFSKVWNISTPNIFIYVSKDNEVQTISVINGFLKTDSVWVPRCNGFDLEAVKIQDLGQLKLGSYGILEPSSDFKNTEDLNILDFIILPGLSFDLNGGRLGKGKGFYDRFLKKVSKRTFKIGLAYDFQIQPLIPMEQEDEKVDCIVTEKRIIVSDPSIHLPEELSLHNGRKVL